MPCAGALDLDRMAGGDETPSGRCRQAGAIKRRREEIGRAALCLARNSVRRSAVGRCPGHAPPIRSRSASQALTGAVAQRQAEPAGAEIWAEDVNAKAGFWGAVELVYYDDQAIPTTCLASTPSSSCRRSTCWSRPMPPHGRARDAGDHAERQNDDQHARHQRPSPVQLSRYSRWCRRGRTLAFPGAGSTRRRAIPNRTVALIGADAGSARPPATAREKPRRRHDLI